MADCSDCHEDFPEDALVRADRCKPMCESCFVYTVTEALGSHPGALAQLRRQLLSEQVLAEARKVWGDVWDFEPVLVRVSGDVNDDDLAYSRQLNHDLEEGGTYGPIILVHGDAALKQLNEDELNAAGWYSERRLKERISEFFRDPAE